MDAHHWRHSIRVVSREIAFMDDLFKLKSKISISHLIDIQIACDACDRNEKSSLNRIGATNANDLQSK